MGHVPAAGITYKDTTIATADEALVLFIKEHTGKMKSLASADLDFYLTTGRQLLNIGKPFHLEGIGTLIKNKDGRLDFTPGEYVVSRLDDLSPEKKAVSVEETGARTEPASGGGSSRQVLLLLGLVLGLVVIGWGGYYLYKRNNIIEPTAENKATVLPDSNAAKKPADNAAAAVAKTDSGSAQKPVDTTVKATVAPVTPPPAAAATPVTSVPVPGEGQSLYRFVILQTGNKNRALRRYNQLLGYQLNIHMDEKDSAYFKLYFPIAAGIRDTTHIKDSLADVYAAQVTIEK